MNYYSPYFGYAPYMSAPTSKGILGSIFGGAKSLNWSGILSNVQKTLGIVNQAIPMVKQVSPIVNNAKTMFKIMNEFKKVDTPQPNNNQAANTNINSTQNQNSETEIIDNNQNDTINNGGPTFFI